MSAAIDLSGYVLRARTAPDAPPEGVVHEIVGLVVEVAGILAAVGEQLEVELHGKPLALEVVGFRSDKLLTAPLGAVDGLRPGTRARLRPGGSLAPVGDALLGRIVDAFGHPLDGGPEPLCAHRAPLRATPPDALSRPPIREPLETGVRAFDGLLPLGRGQRIGLFAGTGVGKSTLLGMLCRRARADVVVVGLVGERGREVGDFVRGALGAEGLARSVVVAATSDAPPLVRARGALYATAVAEHFRDRGQSVLLLIDSVTRYAMAVREASLAAGEPPVTKGYTPSVFASLPRLLERAGTGPAGSITAIYTVLVESDDLSDPIADAVRGILDGHVVLSRSLAERGHFPAIDVLRSVSRLSHELTAPAHATAMAAVRGALAARRDVADLVQIGAYAAGADARVDAALAVAPKIDAFLRQPVEEGSDRAITIQSLARLAAETR